MIRLCEDFYIANIERVSFLDKGLESTVTHIFKYKNYKVELITAFKLIGHTIDDNHAVLNFGYKVGIEKRYNRTMSYEFISDLDSEDGSSTKKYLNSKEAREIVLRFIERRVRKYLKKYKPSIVIRGALSNIMINLPRYARLDSIFEESGLDKSVVKISSYPELYKVTCNKNDNDKEIWVYTRKKSHTKKLKKIIGQKNERR